MNRALLYLIVMQRKNSVIAFFRGLKEPRRLIATLFWVGFLVLFLFSQSGEFTTNLRRDSARTALPALFSILLLTSSVNGLLQRGLTFQPADVDFLFPGPFARRELVLYRLVSLYPFTLVSSALFLLMLRRMAGDMLAGYIGLVLFSLLLVHLQTILGLIATWIEGGLFKRLKAPLRMLAWFLAIVLAFAFVGAATGDTRVATQVQDLFAHGATRVVFYPAAKVAEALAAPSFTAALPAILPLFAAVVCSLLMALLLQVNFIEASLQTSQQGSLLRARMGRGFVGAEASTGKVGSSRALFLPVFRHSGAIVWKNLIAASRSLRFVLYAVMSIGIYTSIVIARGRHGDVFDPIAPRMDVLSLGAMWPLFIQQYVAFDFRRDFDSLAELRQLPLQPFGVAVAEIAVPTFFAVAFQLLGLAGVAMFEHVSRHMMILAVLAYPPITLAMITVTNLGFLLFPSRQAAAAKWRAGGASLSLVAIFNMFVTIVVLAPAIVVGALVFAGLGSSDEASDQDLLLRRIVLAGAATQWLVDVVLLWLLGRTFARFDVSRETG